jgi:nucleoid DNA-binding protein
LRNKQVTTTDIITKIAANTGISKTVVTSVFRELPAVLQAELMNKTTVRLYRIGSFEVKTLKPRTFNNLHTHLRETLGERSKVKVKVSKHLQPPRGEK